MVKLGLQKRAAAYMGKSNPCGLLVHFFFTVLGKKEKVECPVGKVP